MTEGKRANILMVDDAEDVLSVVSDLLRLNDYHVTEASSGEAAVEELSNQRFDVVVTDLEMPVVSGMDVLAAAKRQDPDAAVVMVTAYSTIERAVQAMREGAFDFIPKPVRSEELVKAVERALTKRGGSSEPLPERRAACRAEPLCVATSPAMQRVMQDLERVASSDTTVLLLGESGTGKEMLSRIIHLRSPRRESPLVVINCAAIPSELMENELFGSGERRGPQVQRSGKQGKFELAEKGTILLDEIGELHLSLQAKLLRVLEEKEFERLGGTRTIPLDVRVIVASNRDLTAEVEAGQFREDLFYRLNVFPIDLPPLRQRAEDIPELIGHFVKEMSREVDKAVESVCDEAMGMLMAYEWPGNVRELRNVIERAVILCDETVLRVSHIVMQERRRGREAVSFEEGDSLKDAARKAAADAEIQLIGRVMEEVRWNRRKGAQRLGVSYKTLWNKLKEYELG